MKAIKWNTNRQYAPEGQVITAWVIAEGEDEFGPDITIRFVDESRGIHGEMPHLPMFAPSIILSFYDKGLYRPIFVETEELAKALAAL